MKSLKNEDGYTSDILLLCVVTLLDWKPLCFSQIQGVIAIFRFDKMFVPYNS